MACIQKWTGMNPSEGVLAQTWLDKFMAINPVETVNANTEGIIII